LLCCIAASIASAHGVNPVGLWRSIDDRSGEPRWLLRIVWDKQTDEYKAIVEKILSSSGDPKAYKCDKCEDARKDQPLLGMVVMSGLKGKDHDFRGGELLDPDDGKVYRCMLRLSDDGRKIVLRAFRGVSFGRTLTWVRSGEGSEE
jgi:uncharacterized protein (DUF2147 family)